MAPFDGRRDREICRPVSVRYPGATPRRLTWRARYFIHPFSLQDERSGGMMPRECVSMDTRPAILVHGRGVCDGTEVRSDKLSAAIRGNVVSFKMAVPHPSAVYLREKEKEIRVREIISLVYTNRALPLDLPIRSCETTLEIWRNNTDLRYLVNVINIELLRKSLATRSV